MDTAQTATVEISTAKHHADQVYLTDIGSLSREHLAFATALAKCGDPAKAYLATHPRCNNHASAKRHGRRIAKLPGVVAYLARIKVGALGVEGEKEAWEHEVRSIAFAGVNLRKVPVKEKVSALRTLGEAKGWLKQQQVGAGVRATFNFRIGGVGALGSERVISVVGDSQPAGNDAPAPDSPQPSRNIGVDVDLDQDPKIQATEVLPPAVAFVSSPPAGPKNPEKGMDRLFRADNT